MDLQQNEELSDASAPQHHIQGATVVEFDMDKSVDLIRDRLNQTMDMVNGHRNKSDALELSQRYNVPEETITFSKSLLDYFNQNTATNPKAKLLEPFFMQDTQEKWQLDLDAHSERTDRILEAIATAHPEDIQSNVFKMKAKKIQDFVQEIITRLDF